MDFFTNSHSAGNRQAGPGTPRSDKAVPLGLARMDVILVDPGDLEVLRITLVEIVDVADPSRILWKCYHQSL